MSKPRRDGLLWDDRGLNLEPRWEREPNIEAISNTKCSVSFHASGSFNKLYLVKTEQQGSLLMRVSLPVDPHNETSGEVATLRWILVAFDDSSDNKIGFEWILMQLMSGTSAYYRWRGMSMETKRAFVERVADMQAQLFSPGRAERGFRGIGTLKGSKACAGPEPGQIVSPMFFWGPHFDYDVPRGPFRSSHDWLGATLSIALRERVDEIEEAEDEEDRQDAEEQLRITRRLVDLLPKIFPSIQHPAERTILWHGDLSLSNIMVDVEGKITGVIDWECVSTMPVWVASQMPQFQVGSPRELEPIRDGYGDENPEYDKAFTATTEYDDGLDGERKTDLYWIHLMEYEQTRLRKVYADRMRQLWPAWDAEVTDGALKADLLEAVSRCADGFGLRQIEKWVDAIEKGQIPRLADMFTVQTVT
ncbi:phosphotransferase enzyme family-domain-containing protein [Phialemonium atrogriseum]|uniref:Phosphotransferase enzyme family-domain-containing protein n=1 Tax=Phialemonium atrogriseum TaxID=1093897 RepID=A0AAJ0BSI0_9PEZI|nr:phosphotransferase enzyme family-domain-containing protein [Phialemonium atrogriseum]KAK1763456.1 phosphotransferase enzyme family-domain-containing protein [Phialemonium atrogriseum]